MTLNTINILGVIYQIVLVSNEEWVGTTDILKQTIFLNKEQGPDMLAATLFHEIVEIILARMNCLSEDDGPHCKTIMLNHRPDDYDDPFMCFTAILFDTLKRNGLLDGLLKGGV